jgi:hypothetical protein
MATLVSLLSPHDPLAPSVFPEVSGVYEATQWYVPAAVVG